MARDADRSHPLRRWQQRFEPDAARARRLDVRLPRLLFDAGLVPRPRAGRSRRASDTAVCYHSGLPPEPIRWVLVRNPSGESETQAFLLTLHGETIPCLDFPKHSYLHVLPIARHTVGDGFNAIENELDAVVTLHLGFRCA